MYDTDELLILKIALVEFAAKTSHRSPRIAGIATHLRDRLT